MIPRHALATAAFVTLLGACGDDGSPTIEASETGEPPATTAVEETTTVVPQTTATTEVESVDLVLTGDTEVPGPGSTGTAEATLTYDGDQLCLAGTTTGVGAVVAGHIHAGLAGESGPVVIDLGIETEGDGPFEGCATVGAEGGVVLVDPTAYYANLHTAALPDGAVRAQLG